MFFSNTLADTDRKGPGFFVRNAGRDMLLFYDLVDLSNRGSSDSKEGENFSPGGRSETGHFLLDKNV